MTISLESSNVSIQFSETTGTIESVLHRAHKLELVHNRLGSENFRLLLPLPELRRHYIFGKTQTLRDVQQLGSDSIELIWAGLTSEVGIFDIEVRLRFSLDGDTVDVVPTLINNSDHTIEELISPIVGGMNSDSPKGWRLHYPDATGKGNEWSIYEEFPGTYLGPPNPIWQRVYPRELCMPWIDVYNAGGQFGVMFAHLDEESRWSSAFAELPSGTRYGQAASQASGVYALQSWPRRTTSPPTLAGIAIGWAAFPFAEPGSTYEGPTTRLTFHHGTWPAAARIYRQWFQSRWPVSRKRSWLANSDAWQSTIISYPDDKIGYRFSDIPGIAHAAKKHGIFTLQIDGWDVGGLDRSYPDYRPDPRLGTEDDLRSALKACREIGVRVLLFSNLTAANIETDWFQSELHRYAVRDPRGHLRNTMGWEYGTLLGLAKQVEPRMVTMNPSHPEFAEIALDAFKRIQELGADGTQIDKLWTVFLATIDFGAPDGSDPLNSVSSGVLQVLASLQASCTGRYADFAIASETHWDRLMPFVDVSYARHFHPDHLSPIGVAFPEFRESTAIPGPYDFGLVNNAVRHRHVINLEAQYLNGTSEDVPELAAYISAVTKLRRDLREVLWDAEIVPDADVSVDHDGEVLSGVLRSWDTDKEAIVLNHFSDQPQSVGLSKTSTSRHTAHVFRPGRPPETLSLPGKVSIDPEELAVVVYDDR